MQLKELLKGHEYFKKVKFSKNEERFKELVKKGQNPKALFIGCSDSRVVPNLITNAKPGDLFVVRNIGNLVPPFKPDNDFHSTAAAIEYAVSVLNVSDIIVCGHSNCGAIEATFKKIEPNSYNIHTIKWLQLAEMAKESAILQLGKDAPLKEQKELTERLSIIFQLENLLTYPAIKEKVESKELFLHGWYYIIEDGIIEYYNEEKLSFERLL